MNIFLPSKIVNKNQQKSLKAHKREEVGLEVEALGIKNLIDDIYYLLQKYKVLSSHFLLMCSESVNLKVVIGML